MRDKSSCPSGRQCMRCLTLAEWFGRVFCEAEEIRSMSNRSSPVINRICVRLSDEYLWRVRARCARG
ncbi:hypothetical protein D9M69_372640 [compost metagenome]